MIDILIDIAKIMALMLIIIFLGIPLAPFLFAALVIVAGFIVFVISLPFVAIANIAKSIKGQK